MLVDMRIVNVSIRRAEANNIYMGEDYDPIDMYFPEEFHDALSDLPLAPENGIPPNGLREIFLLTLAPRKKYVIHGGTLRQYLIYGATLYSINRVLGFEQKAWMAPYIEFNIEKRAQIYAYVVANEQCICTAKGVKSNVLQSLRYEDYRDCLENCTRVLGTQYQLRSHAHEVYTESVTKVVLSGLILTTCLCATNSLSGAMQSHSPPEDSYTAIHDVLDHPVILGASPLHKSFATGQKRVTDLLNHEVKINGRLTLGLSVRLGGTRGRMMSSVNCCAFSDPRVICSSHRRSRVMASQIVMPVVDDVCQCQQMRLSEVSIEQRQNAMAGETRDPRENTPTPTGIELGSPCDKYIVRHMKRHGVPNGLNGAQFGALSTLPLAAPFSGLSQTLRHLGVAITRVYITRTYLRTDDNDLYDVQVVVTFTHFCCVLDTSEMSIDVHWGWSRETKEVFSIVSECSKFTILYEDGPLSTLKLVESLRSREKVISHIENPISFTGEVTMTTDISDNRAFARAIHARRSVTGCAALEFQQSELVVSSIFSLRHGKYKRRVGTSFPASHVEERLELPPPRLCARSQRSPAAQKFYDLNYDSSNKPYEITVNHRSDKQDVCVEWSGEIWSRQPMRAKRGGIGKAPECKTEGNGRSPRKPTDQRHRPVRYQLAMIRERPCRESNPVRLGYSSRHATVASSSPVSQPLFMTTPLMGKGIEIRPIFAGSLRLTRQLEVGATCTIVHPANTQGQCVPNINDLLCSAAPPLGYLGNLPACVQERNIQRVVIITDSDSVLVSLASYHWPRDLVIWAIRDLFLQLVQLAVQIQFAWVQSHVGIVGIEYVDRLAKLADG
ncbi:hypothetical protein PR048_019075 [Dryococelus australis]|uniref:RNase H type-1 domain-containing protein n=1 Tax=Dryococelus australis TaxID=614101 RepID=A0ABQ9H2L0_9NEOP|nr:hypothetical protein PR048_019075 [Dryococelus australis]